MEFRRSLLQKSWHCAIKSAVPVLAHLAFLRGLQVNEIDRNTIGGFSQRTWKNYAFLEAAQHSGTDVHIVTQLVVSLLGLIVFPYEHRKQTQGQQFNISLAELTKQGWPQFDIHLGHSETLDSLVKHLRNACSHRRIRFSSDSRDLSDVQIHFWDRKKSHLPDDWGATIDGDGLRDFVYYFASLLR
jgi:hypothetical protein